MYQSFHKFNTDIKYILTILYGYKSIVKVKVAQSCLTLCDPMGCPWNSLGQNIGVGSLSLLQGIFPTQRLNPGLLHCRLFLYQLSHKGSPYRSIKPKKRIKTESIKMHDSLTKMRDFPGSPVVKILPSNTSSAGSIPGWGSKIPHASWPKNQNIRWKQYCIKFNKNFKHGSYQNILKGREKKHLKLATKENQLAKAPPHSLRHEVAWVRALWFKVRLGHVPAA